MDEDPSNEVYVLSMLEGYGAAETNTSPGWTEGSSLGPI
jgi:hypothetical protein